MRGKLKVYGVNTFLLGVQARTIACVASRKQLAALLGVGLGFVQDYAAETRNEEECAIAKAEIGVIFIQCPTCEHWHKWLRKPCGVKPTRPRQDWAERTAKRNVARIYGSFPYGKREQSILTKLLRQAEKRRKRSKNV